jgi:Fur family ferric uptake transcriptional regulator
VHLVCRNCGSIHELDVDVVTPLADALLDEQGFSLDMGHLALFGTCGGCR